MPSQTEDALGECRQPAQLSRLPELKGMSYFRVAGALFCAVSQSKARACEAFRARFPDADNHLCQMVRDGHYMVCDWARDFGLSESVA